MTQPNSSTFTPFSKLTMMRFYLLMIIATLIAVLFIDRPLASMLYNNAYQGSYLKLLSQAPLFFQVLGLSCVLLLCLPRYRHTMLPLVKHLLLTALFASGLRWGGKWLFGRTWPETWVNENPSWIHSGVEGFYPFTQGMGYNSFPSGHTLFTVALACCFWYHLPQYKLLWSLGIVAVFIGQLGQNYHFLGDTLAGATLGVLACHLAHLIVKLPSPK
ncbi:phosphatase PAP2 family protein [Shewanella sp. Scap07]|uniref:phosphatase PAP2 family protein n=1 Tax=Shewanella sp. Scap07 TaxID=2589987 RepID=UPI0021173B48|nr:phosphatase PAP2 family protein [Shewanella sp. Scap07]